MTPHQPIRTAYRMMSAVVCCGVALVASGCSHTPTPPSSPPASSPPAPTSITPIGSGQGLADTAYVDIDPTVFPDAHPDDPQWALTAPIAEAFRWKPAEDTSQFDAFRRAASGWNNQFLRDHELRLSTLVPMSGPSWQLWADQGVYMDTTVRILPDQHPTDTAADQSRVVKIDLFRHGAQALELTVIAAVRVHNTPTMGWRVDSFTAIDIILGDK